MYFYKEDLINLIVPDQPDPSAAKVLQETLGGRFGEMRTMMQFFFQSSNFRGKATQYRDLIRGIFLEEISHVELVQQTINQLLTGAGAEGAIDRYKQTWTVKQNAEVLDLTVNADGRTLNDGQYPDVGRYLQHLQQRTTSVPYLVRHLEPFSSFSIGKSFCGLVHLCC